MIVLAGVGEDAGVHLGMERLDPSLKAFGESGEGGHLDDRDAGVGDGLGGGAGGDDLHSRRVQGGGEFGQSALVVDTHERPADGSTAVG